MRLLFGFAIAVVFGVIVACSDAKTSGTEPPPNSDASSTTVDSGASAADGSPSTTTPTKTTALDATIAGVTRTLGRAQFGRSKSDAGETFYIEAHEGGDPACPTETSPTPKRTVIVSGLPVGAPGDVFTKTDGVTVSFLDFTGDQLPGKPVTKATSATVTIVAGGGTTSVEIEVDATFEEGTAKGRIYATYCASLSE